MILMILIHLRDNLNKLENPDTPDDYDPKNFNNFSHPKTANIPTIQTVTDVYVGKHTDVFDSQIAQAANSQHCFTCTMSHTNNHNNNNSAADEAWLASKEYTKKLQNTYLISHLHPHVQSSANTPDTPY